MATHLRRVLAGLGLIVFTAVCTAPGCVYTPVQAPTLPAAADELSRAEFADALVSDAVRLDQYLVITTGLDRQIQAAVSPDVVLESSLQVLDAATMDRVARLPLEGEPLDIAMWGNVAYVASGDWLHIVDLSVPSLPTLAAQIQTSAYSRAVTIIDGILVVGQGTGTLEEMTPGDWPRLWMLDVSANPAKPVEIGTLLVEGPVSDVIAGESGWVYTAEWDAGVGAYNVVAFAEAGKELQRRYPTPDGRVDGVAVEGHTLYAGMAGGQFMSSAGEIRVFDVEQPDRPIAGVGLDVWVRNIVPRGDGSVWFVGVDPTGSQIGVAAPRWPEVDPVVLVDYRDGNWQFAIDLVADGDIVHALVARPTGRLDLSGAGGCAVRIDDLDTSLRSFEVHDDAVE